MAPKPEEDPKTDELQEQIDTEAAAAAEEQQQEQQQVEEQDLDADTREMLEAEREAEAEAKGGKSESEQDQDGDDPEPGAEQQEEVQPEPEQQPDEQQQRPRDRMVPLTALQQERQRARDLELRLARLEGRLEAGERPAAQDQEKPKEPTPEERRAALEADLEALDQDYEDGKVGFKERNSKARSIERQINALDREPAQPQPEQRSPDPRRAVQEINDDGDVARVTMDLNRDNPWLVQPTPGLRRALQQDLEAIAPRGHEWAAEIARRAGLDYSGLGPKRQTIFLRLGMVAAAEEAGVDKQYMRTIDQPAPPAKDQPQQGRRPNPGAPTIDQRRKKSDLAGKHPPDLTQAGTPSAGSTRAITDEDIERMSDEEIDALPDSMLEKYTGTRR